MNEQENSELIEVVLGLLEKSKQQDESMQKAIQEMKRQGSALETLRRAIEASAFTGVSLGVKNALETQNKALDEQISRISSATGNLVGSLNKARKEFTWQNFLWQYGCFFLVVMLAGAFMYWFIPSQSEIARREAWIKNLDKQIADRQELLLLQTSKCSGQLCVRIDRRKCGYSVKKGEAKGDYCIVNRTSII